MLMFLKIYKNILNKYIYLIYKLDTYIFIFCIGILLFTIICILLIYLSYFFGNFNEKITFEKNSLYECGFQPFFDFRHFFNIEFFKVGILFLIFDLEIIFLVPLTKILKNIDSLKLIIIISFMLLLILGVFYELKKNILHFNYSYKNIIK